MSATGWLINPHCKVDGTKPERRKTKHLYLKLDNVSDKLIDWVNKTKSGWSANAASITESWINKGLLPRAITRDLKWGVPIPKVEGLDEEEYKNKVFYVWFDACIGYVTLTASLLDGDDLESKKWEEWWKRPDDVDLYQFMGKDNVPFHTIVFPASQIGTGENWTKVKHLSATEYLTYEGGKFSKSRGIGVFGNNAQDTGLDPDIFRFYLLSRRPESGSDTEFSWEELISGNNNELLKNLGNFVQRVVKFCSVKMESEVPAYTVVADYQKEVNTLLKAYIDHMEAIKIRQALMTILQLSSLGNKLLQDNKLDNRLFTEEPARCKDVIGNALDTINLLASMLSPFMPETSKKIFKQLGVDPTPHIPDEWTGKALKPGHKLGEPQLLFSQILPAKLAEWRDAYGGDELKEQKRLEAEKAAAKKAAKAADKAKKAAKKAAAKGEQAAPAGDGSKDGTTATVVVGQ